MPAARPLHTTPAYGIWKAQRAVFGAAYGMEHVNYFAPEGEALLEVPSFRRSNAHQPVAEECRAVREAVGINEIHNFGKYEVTGPGAEAWLNHVMAGRLPKEGRISLNPMLAESVNVACPEDGSPMILRTGRFGKFLACTRYPDCKGSMPIPLGVDCPECGKPLAKRKSKKGRTFYGCTAYPESDFASWSKPVAIRCTTCNYGILVERDTKKEGRHYHCPSCKSVIDPDSL